MHRYPSRRSAPPAYKIVRDGKSLASLSPVAWTRGSVCLLYPTERIAKDVIAARWVGVNAARELLGIRAVRV